MPLGKRAEMLIEQRREAVAELFLQGLTGTQIVARLGWKPGAASEMRVSRDITAIRKQWQSSAIRKYDEAKAKVLHEWHLLKKRAWESFELSMQGADKDGNEVLKPGDAKFLAVVADCIREEAQLQGLTPKPGSADLPTSPPVLSFHIHSPDSAAPKIVEPLLLESIPLGEDPNNFEAVDVPDVVNHAPNVEKEETNADGYRPNRHHSHDYHEPQRP